MKSISLKGSVLAIAIASTLAAQAQEGEFTVDPYSAEIQQKEQVVPDAVSEKLTKEELETFKVMLNGSGLSDDLTKSEMELINRKGHILFKHLYEQNQLRDLRSILEEEARNKKIKDMKENEFPLSPNEILALRNLAKSVDKASNAPLDGPIDFAIKTVTIDVDAPKPIQIMVAKGYSSSIMFFDQSGAPWPIEGDIIGDKQSFMSHAVEGKAHVGVFEIKRAFSESNALVNLKGLNVPVVVRLTGSEETVDARISVRIPKFGPDAQLNPYVHSEIENANPDMLSVLNGDKLNGAKMFNLNGVPGTVWFKNNMLFVRTRANLISPPWKSHMTSVTGYQVYELPPVTNLLFTVDGEMRNATIEKGFEVKLRQKQSIFQD